MTRTWRFWMCCALLLLLGSARATAGTAGNPYSFYGSVSECAAAERNRCEAINGRGDADAECEQLAAGEGRGYSLMCINLALAIDAVAACAARRAPSCPRDIHASESIASLEANAGFLDDPACAAPLDGCLARLYGPPGGGFSGPSSGGSPPRDTSVGCDDSCNGDSNCDAATGCELDSSSDDGCSDSGESSGCGGCEDSGAGDPGTADSCEGDTEDSCGSEDNASCDDSDCGGGGESDCDSSSGGGDCEGGGGGECDGGGGGDCGGGGGGDCNVSGKRGRAGATLPIAVAWALLPLPFAILVRRRAERRRARAAWDAAPRAEGEAP